MITLDDSEIFFLNISNSSNFTATWEVALFSTSGFFSLGALFLSMFLIYRHLKHWTDPITQIYIVRILLMVPIYAVDSWLSIRFHHYSIFFNIVRDCYESYVLYQFFALMIRYFEKTECKEGETIDDKLYGYPKAKCLAPFCCLPKLQVGPIFMLHTRRCVLQYVIIKPLCTLMAIAMEIGEVYHDGEFVPWGGYLWITIILNVSVCVSLYYLLIFYTVIKKVLKPFHPILKLLSIKAIIGVAFWQTVIIAVLGFFEVIPSFGEYWPPEEVAMAINNFLLCFEMFILSICNFWVYGYDEYRPEERANETMATKSKNVLTRLTKDVVNQADMIHDSGQAISHKHYKVVREKHRASRARAEQEGLYQGLDATDSDSSSSESSGDEEVTLSTSAADSLTMVSIEPVDGESEEEPYEEIREKRSGSKKLMDKIKHKSPKKNANLYENI